MNIQDTARELRDALNEAHARTMGEYLGCTMTVLRVEPVKRNGKFTGITEPVFGMPAEFVEQAQALGLLAEAR